MEDNELNMEMAVYSSGSGAFCVSAMDGREVLNKFAASAPGEYDCVLMDIMMPEMDGLRRRGRSGCWKGMTKTVPVVAMTANAFAETSESRRMPV